MTGKISDSGRMTRKQFIRKAGLGAAALGAAAMGLGGAAKAAALPAGGAVTDPHGLLVGAGTLVPAAFNPSSGELSSKVTSIKFHTNQEIPMRNAVYTRAHAVNGAVVQCPYPNDPDLDGYDPAKPVHLYEDNKRVPSDWSTQKAVNPDPFDGLVDDPALARVEKSINGVEFIEYSGEISGYINDFENDHSNALVYGPVGEPDEPEEWKTARQGLKGINFILKIPKQGWNGILVDYHTGGWYHSAGIYNGNLDEIYLLSQGYAHVGSFASGYESRTDTNHNNDEYFENVMAYTYAWTVGGPSIPPRPLPSGFPTEANPSIFYQVYIGDSSMYIRDFAALMKNLCRYETGNYPEFTYYNPRSATGNGALSMASGKSFDYYGSGEPRYFGNNYLPAFSNCPKLPDGMGNPQYDPGASMVFDGFLVLSPAMDFQPLDANVPITTAPMVVLTGETDLFLTHFNGLVLPFISHMAKQDQANGHLWPDTTKTFFYYSFEHLPHFPKMPGIFALAYNGGGVYYDPSGATQFNTDGEGQELDLNWGRLAGASVRLGIPFDPAFGGALMGANYTSFTVGGTNHQLLDNLHQYVKSRRENPEDPGSWILPPASNIDKYWTDGNNKYPKFPYFLPNHDDAMFGPFDISKELPLDPGNPGSGLYRAAIDYINAYDVLSFNKTTWRMPEDQARLGLFASVVNGMAEPILRPFSEAELTAGFGPGTGNEASKPRDWNNLPLVTMKMRNGRTEIPQDGYKTHGGYVSAIAQAVNILVQNRLYDPYIGALLVTKAAGSDYPLVESKNLGQAMVGFTEQLHLRKPPEKQR